jgi:hypothetical protein
MKRISDSFKLSYGQAKYNLRDMGGQHEADSNYYKANSHRLRSPELSEHADIVISGCSFSYGVGVPEEMSWGVQVANHFNLPYHNLSTSGKGTTFLVDHLFSYFKNYGHPKILICLFPEPTRIQVYSDPKHMVSKNHFNPKSYLSQQDINETDQITFNATLEVTHDFTAKYAKAPYHAEDVLPVETAVALSLQHIRFLEMYCKAAGIKLIWSTWNDAFEFGLENNGHEYENYISVYNRYWHSRPSDLFYDRIHSDEEEVLNPHSQDPYHNSPEECTTFIDCHSEFRDKFGTNWDLASDIGRPTRHHWGIHRHKHVADFFINEINSKQWL